MTDTAENDDLQRAIAGDSEAVSRVWCRHRRTVAAVLLAHGARQADLEDLLQDVAVAVVQHLSRLRDARAFRPWLRTVTVHTLQSSWQRRARRARELPLPIDDASSLADPRAPVGGGDSTAARLTAVLAIVNAMQPEYREPMWLRTVQGLSQQAIADTLSLPVTTVETRLARARRMLRASLADQDAARRSTLGPRRNP